MLFVLPDLYDCFAHLSDPLSSSRQQICSLPSHGEMSQMRIEDYRFGDVEDSIGRDRGIRSQVIQMTLPRNCSDVKRQEIELRKVQEIHFSDYKFVNTTSRRCWREKQ
jgi:hypothetical protein